MLALATTTATVTGDAPGEPDRDAHGAPLPSDPVTRGPMPAHRQVGVTVLLDDGTEAQGSRWSLDAAAWPVRAGDVITDATDSTRWSVVASQLVPSGLGLQQVQADVVALVPDGT